VSAVLQRQDHLGQALELLPKPIAQLRPMDLVQGRLAEGFALEYQGQVALVIFATGNDVMSISQSTSGSG
jgi:hypothetical protein